MTTPDPAVLREALDFWERETDDGPFGPRLSRIFDAARRWVGLIEGTGVLIDGERFHLENSWQVGGHYERLVTDWRKVDND